MKNNLILKAVRLIAVAGFFTAASAIAGPGPQMLYVPVKSATIAPGTRLAANCPKCHAVFPVTKGYDKSVSCPGCKVKFVRKDIGGRGATVGSYVYTDAAGHEVTLLQAM